jgi:transcriptional antiterminator
MGTATPYDRRVPKAKWTPDEQIEREVAALVEKHRKIAAAEAEYRADLARLAQPNGPVPIAYLADKLNVERKTVYRHLGRSMS